MRTLVGDPGQRHIGVGCARFWRAQYARHPISAPRLAWRRDAESSRRLALARHAQHAHATLWSVGSGSSAGRGAGYRWWSTHPPQPTVKVQDL